MAAPLQGRRRPAESSSTSEAGSDEDFGDALLDGVFSASEDDSLSEASDNADDYFDAGFDFDVEGSHGDAAANGANTALRHGPRPETAELGRSPVRSASATRSLGLEHPDDDKPNYSVTVDANGNTRYQYDEIDPVYDSDDTDFEEAINTVGDIPLSFYDSYPHIGYDINGKKIMRPAAGDALDALLDSIEVPKGWTGLVDPETGQPHNLSQEELELVGRIMRNDAPEEGYDPYPEMVEYFTGIEEKMPLSAAPEPKRRFVPSKHEAKRVAKLVRAIREGRILPYKPPEEREREEQEKEEEDLYDLWADEVAKEPHIMNIPAPKLPPPGYDLSYNPPAEYLMTQAEKEAWEKLDPEEREKEYVPAKYGSLRKVPAYGEFVKERFERCLDLYLAPRIRKNRLNIDPSSLLPKLPRPEELKPYPTVCQTVFGSHQARVRSAATSPDGEYVASGGDDGTLRIWRVGTGHQEWEAKLSREEPVDVVRWRPNKDSFILAAAAGEDIYLVIPPNLTCPEKEEQSRTVLDAGFGYAKNGDQTATTNGARKTPAATWSRPPSRLQAAGVLLMATMRFPVKVINWHRRGDYFCTVAPTGQKSAVAIHTLSKHLTQIPFPRLRGLAQTAQFHPTRDFFLIATRRMIRYYDLTNRELIKVIQPGAKWISSLDVHPAGENLIVGSYDRRLLWHEIDLSIRPFKTMRFHAEAVRAVKFHRGGFPLFADASDDGSLQIFHGKVVSDLMENPTIVPIKKLRGHKVVDKLGVMDVDWHASHPWCVSAGADGTCRVWT